MRAPCSISTRPSSRAWSRSRQSPSSRRCTASIWRRSGAASSALNPDCHRGRAVPCWPRWGSIALIAVGDGPAQFEGSVTGVWRAPLRLKVKMSGTGLDVEAEGTAEPWAAEPKASVNLKVRSADLGPLLDLKASDPLARNIGLSSRVSLSGNRLTFDDLDSAIAGSRLRGRMVLVARRRKERRGRARPRYARSRAGVCARHRRCGARRRRAARFRILERLARPHRVSVAAWHASGRRRIAAGQRHPQRRRRSR